MKKIITIIVLVLGITLTTQAQKKNKDHRDDLTVAQKTELQVKKMTLKLDLTDGQIKQVTPIIRKQVEERTAMHKKRKASKEDDKKPTADERYEKTNKALDKKIAFKKKMKQILNEEQYKKFEKTFNRKGKKGKKGNKGKKHSKSNKE